MKNIIKLFNIGEQTMTRQTLIRKLQAMENIDIPEGHARTNKGIPSYFFKDKTEVEQLLEKLGLTMKPLDKYNIPANQWTAENRSIIVYDHTTFASVSIIYWYQ